jgi:flavin-dependent dehydrogenase
LRQKASAGQRLRSRKKDPRSAHILSGAVIDPKAINELIPDWRALGALATPVARTGSLILTRTKAFGIPTGHCRR